ncbi:hypothetical protein DPMN_054771 [Dreissena polymorpha]|uniref:Uncharacterized protein n=1 Tax=Dreissena polymorpha TaxID=45954 RepID=A0A9D4CNQ3_DREPO|nr:hypothetical protein DPMN_054771 [Dreissena polymorpha]
MFDTSDLQSIGNAGDDGYRIEGNGGGGLGAGRGGRGRSYCRNDQDGSGPGRILVKSQKSDKDRQLPGKGKATIQTGGCQGGGRFT